MFLKGWVKVFHFSPFFIAVKTRNKRLTFFIDIVKKCIKLHKSIESSKKSNWKSVQPLQPSRNESLISTGDFQSELANKKNRSGGISSVENRALTKDGARII